MELKDVEGWSDFITLHLHWSGWDRHIHFILDLIHPVIVIGGSVDVVKSVWA